MGDCARQKTENLHKKTLYKIIIRNYITYYFYNIIIVLQKKRED